MFSLSTAAANFQSTQKKFKKFGKKLRKQRQEQLDNMKEKLKEISQDEIKRSQNLFQKHKDFFKETQKTSSTPTTEVTAIDFYEKP
ncbi:hypothetical protein [Bathycoccus sp. RCC716 virus 1]|uniref:Uncharacterized protein n=1 Tax=Bathycoccus sp. RCC716 virus 1 TaxID=2530038 RepID=A0A7S6NY18_9PHYC|nr:hypothetical protein [Bathycoccus sp. RCC716 virus 1]